MSRTHDMQEAIDLFAEVYANMSDADDFHGALQAVEARALADVLAAGGYGEDAAALMRAWAEADPEAAEELDEYEPGWLDRQCEAWEAGE